MVENVCEKGIYQQLLNSKGYMCNNEFSPQRGKPIKTL